MGFTPIEQGFVSLEDTEPVKDAEEGEKFFLETYFPTVKKAKDIYKKEVTEGLESMKGAYEEPSLGNIGRGVLGMIQYGFSPLTAFAKGVVRTPVETGVGLVAPEPVSKFAGELAETAAYFVPYGGLVKRAITTGEKAQAALQSTKVMDEITKESIKTKPPLQFPTAPTAEMMGKLEAEGQLTKPFIQEGIQKQIADEVAGVIGRDFTEKKRIGQQIVDLINEGNINWGGLPDVIKKYNITPQEFAIQLKDTYSAAGRTLGRLSGTVTRLRKTFEGTEFEKFLGGLEKELPESTRMDKFLNSFYSLERTRRGLLVTQLATSVRNAMSQAARVTVGSIDEAFQGAINATIGGKGNFLEEVGRGFDNFFAFANRLSPSKRKEFANVLDNMDEVVRMKLFSAPVHEATLGKMADKLNFLNRTQEYFFRKIAFESKLTRLLKERGMDIKSINPKIIPRDILDRSVDYALEMTFAAIPKSKFGKKFVSDWAGNPIMTALFNPFPRFAFGNALPYIKRFSPVSFFEALNPKVVAELASGNPEKFAKLASEAMLGTIMLSSAVAYRNSPERGDKYWEIKVGDKTVDTRAYAPLVTPYLFLAEMISNPDKIKGMDVASAFIGLNRIAGTGLVLPDILRGKKMEDAVGVLSRLAGEYIGSFTVPFKTIKDLYSVVDPKEKIIRERRELPIISPAVSNIPLLSQKLPEAISPVKEKPIESERPVLRQLTGLSVKTKTLIESEIDRLGMDKTRIYPKTGIPKADREISRYMGPIIEKIAPLLLENSQYQEAPEPMKRILLAELFGEVREEARKRLEEKIPELALQIKYEGLQGDVKELLKGYEIKMPKEERRGFIPLQ